MTRIDQLEIQTSIVIPIWNEEEWVSYAYSTINSYISENNINAQIVFATDGCTDRTVEIIHDLMKKDPKIILYNDPNKLGRGLALRRVIKALKTKYIVYMDSDLATDLKHLPELIEHLKDGADIVTGSRLMKDSNCTRAKKRNNFSIVYNLLCRLIFNSELRDHQCGFKGFNRESILPFIDEVENTGWSWDTEILIRGQKRKLRIDEFPVTWEDPKNSEQSKVNVWKDAKNMGKNLIILRWKLFSQGFQQLIKFSMVGIVNTFITTLTLWILDNTIGRDIWSYPFAYLIGAINSFFMNKRFTFNQKEINKKTALQFIGFILTSILGLIIYTAVSVFAEGILDESYKIWFITFENYVIANFVGTIINFLFQFMISKFTIFRTKDKLGIK